MLFSHLLVHPATTGGGSGRTLLWNYDEVLLVLEDPRWAHVVAAVVSGHQHEGGLHTSETGAHYVVMESPMLGEPGQPGPYAVVEAHGGGLGGGRTGTGRGGDARTWKGVEKQIPWMLTRIIDQSHLSKLDSFVRRRFRPEMTWLNKNPVSQTRLPALKPQ
jgi:hypothetical protein